MYVAFALKGTTTHILYKYPNFCEDIFYVINYYQLCILL